MRRWKRATLWLVPLASLGACGGTSKSTRPGENAGATLGSSGSSGNAGASADGGVDHAGTSASSAGTSTSGAASLGGAAASSSGGVADGGTTDGGAADGGSTAGAGGEQHCVDVCALHGASCCVQPAACVDVDARCTIDIFAATLSTIPYQYADLEQAVASLPQAFTASLNTADMDWAGADPPAAGRIELHLSSGASAHYGTALEGADRHPFRVSCDGQSLFFGLVYMLGGAAAINTPVLHVSREVDDSVVLRLGAVQGAWALASTPVALAARERLDQPRLRATLCLKGALPGPQDL